MNAKCISCHKDIGRDDIGLTKKLINRGAEEFYCIDCLAAYFKVSTELLYKKIEEFREQGCTLF